MIYTECGSRLSFQSWDTNIATNWEECKVHSWSTLVTISKKYLASCCFYRGKEWCFWNKVCCQTWVSCCCRYQWRCQKWTLRQYHNGNFACLWTGCREDLSIYWYLMSQFKAQSRTTGNYYFTLRDVFDKKRFSESLDVTVTCSSDKTETTEESTGCSRGFLAPCVLMQSRQIVMNNIHDCLRGTQQWKDTFQEVNLTLAD